MLASAHVQVQNSAGQDEDVWIVFEQELAPKNAQKLSCYNDMDVQMWGLGPGNIYWSVLSGEWCIMSKIVQEYKWNLLMLQGEEQEDKEDEANLKMQVELLLIPTNKFN